MPALFFAMKTFVATAENRERDWYVVDAEGQTLGRLATQIADALRGKRKPTYTPHVDTGDFVVVVNAEKIRVTGDKLAQKTYWRHSGYPGGIKSRSLGEMLERRPEEVIRKAVKGMLPRNRLARRQLTKLKVYAGPTTRTPPSSRNRWRSSDRCLTRRTRLPSSSSRSETTEDGPTAGPVAEEAPRPRRLRARRPTRRDAGQAAAEADAGALKSSPRLDAAEQPAAEAEPPRRARSRGRGRAAAERPAPAAEEEKKDVIPGADLEPIAVEPERPGALRRGARPAGGRGRGESAP